MPDFDDDLRSLAGHAQRTGRLDPAAAVRRRADRRRRSRYAATGGLGLALLGALTVGIAVIRPDALPPTPPAVSPSAPDEAPSPSGAPPSTPSPIPSSGPSSGPSSVSPAPSLPPSSAPPKSPSRSAGPTTTARGVLSGTRQVFILPENNEATVAVDTSMNAGLSEDFGDRALFVFKPDGDRFSIRTAKLRVDDDPANETYCLAATSGKVVATACDSSDDDQLFVVLRSGTSTSGKPVYVIRTADYVFLRVATPSSNLTATKIEEGTADAGTDFLLPDRGKASLPALD